MSAELYQNGYVTYWGVGAGRSTAYYPSNSNSKFAWKLFLGGRAKYVGVEAGYNQLSVITATVNAQQVDITTEAFSLSLLGYIPLEDNADIFLRYGGVSWSVSAKSSGAGYLPVQSGFNRVYGAGLEMRSHNLFLRLEKEFFREIYQSNFYTFSGISLGAYF